MFLTYTRLQGEKEKGSLSVWTKKRRKKKNSVEDFDTAPLSGSPLYLLVERSEGATIQLTTCGARPKPCESQRWCVSTTELHARARGASLCGSNTEAACHRVPSLWHNALSLPYRVHVFMCLHHMCALACIYAYRVITFHLFGNVFYKSMCAHRCVFVCERVPGEGMARLCFAERLPKATRLAHGARVDILLSIICTNNMVTYQ